MDFNFGTAHTAHKTKIVTVIVGACAAAKKGLSHIAFLLKKAATAVYQGLAHAANAVYQGFAHAATAVYSYARRNPEVVIAVAVVAAGILIMFVPQFMLLITSLLEAAGFGSMGPIAGSMAAWVQAWIGNVAAGGIFATLQSAAMGGYGLATVVAVVQGVAAAAVAVGAAVIAWFTRV